MKKLIMILVFVLAVATLGFNIYYFSGKFIKQRDTNLAQAVIQNVVNAIYNEVQQKGAVAIAVKDKDGQQHNMTLVEKVTDKSAIAEQTVSETPIIENKKR